MFDILVADDHSIVRYGLVKIIASIPEPVNVSTVENFDDAIALLSKKPFDLLILDINLPGGNSTSMLSAVRLRCPDLMILIFSAYSEDVYALNYLRAGADGYLSKNSSEDETKLAIQSLLKREKYIRGGARQVLSNDQDQQKHPGEDMLSTLSAREIDVMNLLTKGYPIQHIANVLHIHLSTVSTYKMRIFTKLKVNNIVELLEKLRLQRDVIQ
jgi:DNA-binding NarL/FixJ family response regulator